MTLLRLTAAIALASAGLASASLAQSAKYPDHSVKVVVGFSAGGGTDVAGRVIAQKLSEAMGQTFVVENRPGASGLIASEAVAKTPADGYTLMVGSQTTLAVAPALYRKTHLDATKDFAGIAMAGISPLVAVVNPSLPVHSIKDLIAMAKEKNGTMNFGSGGVGTTPHMAGELFAFMAGVKLVHVAYRGEAPAINDLLGGQIPFMFANLSAVIGNVQAGKLRAIGITSAKRSPSAPEIPPIAEQGLPGFDAATWFALVGPAGMTPDIVAKLNAEVIKAVAQPDVQQRFAALGMTADEDRTPEAVNAYIKSEIAKWEKVIKDAGVKPAE
jgi:tripartite-type tricarboxylate transporter receptor subunit TctC